MGKIKLCYIHDVEEPWSQASYAGCFECGHVWQTPEEFRADRDAIVDSIFDGEPDVIEARQDTPLDEEWICPLCTHDLFMEVPKEDEWKAAQKTGH